MLAPFRRRGLLIALVLATVGCDGTSRLRTEQSAAEGRGKSNSSSATDGDQTQASGARRTLQPDDWFEDVTEQSGVHFNVDNGRSANRLMAIEGLGGGGVAMFDYDGDGDMDLFITGGGSISTDDPPRMDGQSPALFQNHGGWQFTDVTQMARVERPVDYSQGCTVIDFNVDGFSDVLICCYGKPRLYRNQGDGTFENAGDVLPVPDHLWGTGAACGDVDRDGLPDIFLLRYADWSPETNQLCYSPDGIPDVCSPQRFNPTRSVFFHNLGDGWFEDWTEHMGLLGNCYGLGVLAADLNADGWVDFFVGSDSTANQLYLGGPDIRFREAAAESGVATGANGQAQGSMGVDAADYDGDGLIDLWVVNFDKEDDSLYRNLGGGLFELATYPAGLAGHTRMRSGFGTSLCDFDGDGWPDIFIFNGNPLYHIAASTWKQGPQLFRNRDGRRFLNVTEQGGTFFHEALSGRGSATGDLDDDGAPDIAAAPINDPVHVLRNRQAPRNFVRIEPRARRGEPDATGARITSEFDGRQLVRFVVRGSSFFSHSDPRLILPLAPDVTSAQVIVEWPGRGRERFAGLAPRASHLLIEGRGEALP